MDSQRGRWLEQEPHKQAREISTARSPRPPARGGTLPDAPPKKKLLVMRVKLNVIDVVLKKMRLHVKWLKKRFANSAKQTKLKPKLKKKQKPRPRKLRSLLIAQLKKITPHKTQQRHKPAPLALKLVVLVRI